MSFKLGVRREMPMKAFSTLRMRYACPSASSQAVMSKLSRPSGLNTLSCKSMRPSVKPGPASRKGEAAAATAYKREGPGDKISSGHPDRWILEAWCVQMEQHHILLGRC